MSHRLRPPPPKSDADLTLLRRFHGAARHRRERSGDVTFPAPLREFVELFGAARFWDSHEALEGAWREGRSDFYQGLILYASAWVHWQRGNAHGVRAQLDKAHSRLSQFPDDYLGLAAGEIRDHCTAASRIVSEEAGRWPDHIAPLSLTLETSRIRGDEPELET